MDNRIILAVAGSGKTTLIIDSLAIGKRSLIVTYTINNVENLRLGIIRKFGCMPQNIHVMTYYSFLHSFCYMPFLSDQCKTKGLIYKANLNIYAKGESRYLTSGRRLYSNRLAKYIIEKGVIDSVKARIERYFDELFIDEIQDFAGNDFSFLCSLSNLGIPQLYVGDYYQHTYDTSRDGSVNRNLHKDYDHYKDRFLSNCFEVDENTLSRSHRCRPAVCEFVTKRLGINISSHLDDDAVVEFCDDLERTKAIRHCRWYPVME